MEAIKKLKSEQYKIDRKVVDYSLGLLKPYYEHRREVVKDIPRFWAVVVGENEPLQPYITFEDSLAFDALKDVYIQWDPVDSRNFEIAFDFGDNPHFSAQVLSKRLVWNELSEEDGFYTSAQATNINWNDSSALPVQHTKGEDKSFFLWFAYTSTDDLEGRGENTAIAQLLVDEIYPSALEFYEVTQDDQDVAEEYDISDDE